jgi:hypothetical protein
MSASMRAFACCVVLTSDADHDGERTRLIRRSPDGYGGSTLPDKDFPKASYSLARSTRITWRVQPGIGIMLIAYTKVLRVGIRSGENIPKHVTVALNIAFYMIGNGVGGVRS